MPRLIDRVRARVRDVRVDGEERLEHLGDVARERVADGTERLRGLEADALGRVEHLLDRAPENVPVLSRAASRASDLVHARLELVNELPVADYDTLGVRSIRASLGGLDRVQLARIRGYEDTNKGRVSVLREIDREVARRLNGPEGERDGTS